MSEYHQEPEVPEEEVPVVECLDGLARNTLEALAITLSEKWHPPECLFYKIKSGCRFGEKGSYAHRQVDNSRLKVQKEWWQKNSSCAAKGWLVWKSCYRQSGPSGKKSFIPSEGDSSNNSGADHQRLHISDLHFDKFPTPATFCLLEDKVQDRGMYLFTIFYGSNAMNKEVQKVDSADDFKYSCAEKGAKFWSIRCEDCFSTEPNHP